MLSIRIVFALEKALAGTTAAVGCTIELSATFTSNSAADTLAVFVQVPGTTGRKPSVTMALLPAARVPRAQVRCPPTFVQLPWLATEEINAARLSKASVKMTPLASDGPRFVIAIAYVRSLPTAT